MNTPNSCQPGSLNGSKTQKQVERSKNWKLGQLRDGCGTATAPLSRSLHLPGLFQPQFQGQNSSSCTCRELSMGQTPVEHPLGSCRVLLCGEGLSPSVTDHRLQRAQQRNNRKNPPPVLGMMETLGILCFSLPLPSLTHLTPRLRKTSSREVFPREEFSLFHSQIHQSSPS